MPVETDFDGLCTRLEQGLKAADQPVLLAIDGRCGSGKTTLARLLQERFPARIFHTDDFYLPFSQRIPDWRRVVGANMDFFRLRHEVLLPAQAGETVCYRPYLAHADRFQPTQVLEPAPLSILEGSYSLHPDLNARFDLTIFVTCAPPVQVKRLQAREGENYSLFQGLWIPLEEQYFQQHQIQQRCDLVLDTTDLKEKCYDTI